MTIEKQLLRIYGERDSTDAAVFLAQYSDADRALYASLPSAVRAVGDFMIFPDTFPHERVRMLWGVDDLIEANGPRGARADHLLYAPEVTRPFDRLIQIGDDCYLDPAGQVGPAGGVVEVISYDYEGGTVVAPSLLVLLEQAGSYQR
jgi:hypothetical protein